MSKDSGQITKKPRIAPRDNNPIEQTCREIAQKMTPMVYIDPSKNTPETLRKGEVTFDLLQPHHATQ